MANIDSKVARIKNGGGGTTVMPSHLYQIIGGNDLPYIASMVGVLKVTTTITEIPSGYANGSPSTTIDGVGWARSLDDDSLKIVLNDNTSLISHDIPMNCPVFAMATTSISGAGGGTYTVYRVVGAI